MNHTTHTNSRRTLLTAAAAALTAPLLPFTPRAFAQENNQYLGRTLAQTMSFHGAPWLTREERDAEENTTLLLQQLRLQPGQVVCDLGCGNGYYTLQIAQQVAPTGYVFGSDIQPEMLQLLNQRADEANINNITPVLGTFTDPRIPANSCDLILMVDVYHEFSHPPQMLAAIHRALKPTGVVVLAEYREEDPSVPIKPLHKMSKQQVHKELTANNFKLVRQFDQLPWQHLMFYQRTDGPTPATQPTPWTAR